LVVSSISPFSATATALATKIKTLSDDAPEPFFRFAD
jgi:hypothetical protein